ncbi:MAG: sugar ABC transporter permease [Lachnospiraceae bacterium]|jgi:putative aldouronate transport system permease protein|nr:sugar ABC transporter permease [Lachnospiraceae bacterium]
MGKHWQPRANTGALRRKLINQKYLFLIAVPCLIYIIIFFYGPLYGWLMAFFKYKPSKGIWGSEYVGLYYFKQFFTDPDLGKIVRNTLAMSSLNLIAINLFPLMLALMINEVSSRIFKRTIQTLTYLPHFVSFVVVSNIFLELLGTNGPVNELLRNMGVVETAYKFWQQPSLFWLLATFVRVWKEVGWGAIIYLATLAGIDQVQYEAAAIDGCGRIRRIFYITLPNLLPTVMILWITNMSGLFSASFDASYMLGNATTANVAEVIETYIYKMGLSMGMYSYSTAVSLIQTVLGFALVWLTNKLAQKTTDYSLW